MAEGTEHLLPSGTEVMEPQVVLIQSTNDDSEPDIPFAGSPMCCFTMCRHMSRRRLPFPREINTEGLVMCWAIS